MRWGVQRLSRMLAAMIPSVKLEGKEIVMRLDLDGAQWMVEYLPRSDELTKDLRDVIIRAEAALDTEQP